MSGHFLSKKDLGYFKDKYFDDAIPIEIIGKLLGVIFSSGGSSKLNLLNDEGMDTPWGSTDILDHLEGHGTYTGVSLYGIPKIDLGVCWIKGKHMKGFRRVITRIESEIKQLESLGDLGKAQEMHKMKVKMLEYKNFLKTINRKDWVCDLLEISEREERFSSGAGVEENYGFFTFLAPFYRDEDGKKIKPAYRRRAEFLRELENNMKEHTSRSTDIRYRIKKLLSGIIM